MQNLIIYIKDLIKGLMESKLDYSFCKNIKIKYTTNNVDDSFILKNTLILSKSMIDSMRNDIEKCKMIQDKNNKYVDELNNIIQKQNEAYNSIINSKWWKLRKIFLFWKK